MAKILIGLWSYSSSSNYGSDWKTVVNSFRQKVKDTSVELAKYTSQIDKKNGFKAIFAAPEYIFVGQDVGKKRIPMQASQKDDLLRDLKSISNDYKEILIFPGTIFYREEIQSDLNAKKFGANLIGAHLAAKNRGLDGIVVGTGWSPNGVKVPSLNEVAQKKKTTSYRAFNSVYALLGGDSVIMPYNKEIDCKETEGEDAATLLYIPGSSGGTREIKSFDFAIEVCADHASNVLKGKEGDFHVVVSDWAETKTANMVQKAAGYFLHASSQPTQTCVYNSAKIKVSSTDNATPTSGSLKFWLVDVIQKVPDVPVVVVPVVRNVETVTTSTGKKIIGVKLPF